MTHEQSASLELFRSSPFIFNNNETVIIQKSVFVCVKLVGAYIVWVGFGKFIWYVSYKVAHVGPQTLGQCWWQSVVENTQIQNFPLYRPGLFLP